MDTRESLLEKLMVEAEGDPDFRVRLIDDPTSVLKQVFGIGIPEDVNVVVQEENAYTAHLVLPASAELTDAQLQQVAGGDFCNGQGWSA